MGLYIRSQNGYEIEQRTTYSKIKYKYNNKEIDEMEFYLRKNISTAEFIELSTNRIINKDSMEKLRKLLVEKIILQLQFINKDRNPNVSRIY